MKPRLVDYSLFHKPKPKLKKKIISPPKPKLNHKGHLSFIINIIGILILIIGGLILYQRLQDREIKEIEQQNIIIDFHQYVKKNIN